MLGITGTEQSHSHFLSHSVLTQPGTVEEGGVDRTLAFIELSLCLGAREAVHVPTGKDGTITHLPR